jgi:hypothetical protein
VDIGAVDDLSGLAAFCRDQSIWFHVDAAFGAIALLGLSKPIRSRSTSTNGHRFRTTPAALWCAMPHGSSPPSLRESRIYGATSVAWPVEESGPAILGLICRVAFAR